MHIEPRRSPSFIKIKIKIFLVIDPEGCWLANPRCLQIKSERRHSHQLAPIFQPAVFTCTNFVCTYEFLSTCMYALQPMCEYTRLEVFCTVMGDDDDDDDGILEVIWPSDLKSDPLVLEKGMSFKIKANTVNTCWLFCFVLFCFVFCFVFVFVFFNFIYLFLGTCWIRWIVQGCNIS